VGCLWAGHDRLGRATLGEGVRIQALAFTGPRELELLEDELRGPGPAQVLVQARFSAISPGTELLIYRGHAPQELPADENLPHLSGPLRFPLRYGYSVVGQVHALGIGVDEDWLGRWVFAFQTHQTCFVADVAQLVPLPAGLASEEALFLPNMETAVNLLHDGAPIVGERVVVFGQGIVGLLTTALLARVPLSALLTLDRYPLRRQASLTLGATHSFDPADSEAPARLQDLLFGGGCDLSYELTGDPRALDQAIALTGFAGRVVIGSWYGTQRADLDLGGRFHRSRIALISSQVSTIHPRLSGRWSKARRLDFALQLLREVRPSRFITHRFPFAAAREAFALLDTSPGEAIQVIFEYHGEK